LWAEEVVHGGEPEGGSECEGGEGDQGAFPQWDFDVGEIHGPSSWRVL